MNPEHDPSDSPRLLLLALVLLLGGCMSFRPMTTADARGELEPGQSVRIRTQAGDDVTFKISALTEDETLGDGQAVRFTDVETLERSELSWWRTLGLASVGAGLVALLSGQNGFDIDNLNPGS